MGGGTMLIPQDVVRRQILKTPDDHSNDAIEFIYEIATYGRKIGYDVIVEGILSKGKYGEMLLRLINDFRNESAIYYLDIPFEETVRRHNTRSKNQDFGENEMREWWKEKDYLDVEGEIILSAELSEDELVDAVERRTTTH